jgi:two-component system, OmpR family, alkaline phosphatase synthesis response regulator PhoP
MTDQKKVILIIEDEPPMLNILADKLDEDGFATLQARNGEEGLRLALQHHPDLILLDILMPKMNGITTIHKLREDTWGKTVPVVMLTNVSPDSNETLQEIIKSQPAYYFVKSDIQLTEIVEKVKEVLASLKEEV